LEKWEQIIFLAAEEPNATFFDSIQVGGERINHADSEPQNWLAHGQPLLLAV
jgi:hypothetical protein